MSPGEIRACNRLYAAHRMSNEICAFSEAILAMSDVGASAELAVLARLNTGLEGLRHEMGHVDPVTPGRHRAFRSLAKDSCMLAAQFSSRGALVGR